MEAFKSKCGTNDGKCSNGNNRSNGRYDSKVTGSLKRSAFLTLITAAWLAALAPNPNCAA